jgi:hypothetical protein
MAPTLNADAATAAVGKLTTTPVDSADFGACLDAARNAERAIRIDALEAACPAGVLVPVTSESLQDFNDFVSEMPHERVPETLASLYGMALAGRHKGLMAAIAGPRGRRVVTSAATITASRRGLHGADATAHVDAAVQNFVVGLAGHMRETAPEAAAVLLDVLPDLERRITECEAKHAAHVAAELARIAREQAEADRAIADAEEQRREEVARYFSSRHSHGFVVKGAMLSGHALAELARRHGARDQNGYDASVTLEELELVYRRALAADQVGV